MQPAASMPVCSIYLFFPSLLPSLPIFFSIIRLKSSPHMGLVLLKGISPF